MPHEQQNTSTRLTGLLLVPALPASGLGHLLDGIFDVLPLLVQVVLGAVSGHIVVGFCLRTNRKKKHNKKVKK